MLADRLAVTELARELVTLLDQANLWYVVDCGTLLGAIRHGKMIPWDDDFDIMMDITSFAKLKSLYPERIVDTDTAGYPLLFPKFMKSRHDFLNSAVFVDIFVAIPSTMAKVKAFQSPSMKMRFAAQALRSNFHPFNWQTRIAKVISWPWRKWVKPITYQSVHADLLETVKPEGYFTVDNPLDGMNNNWIKTLSFNRERRSFGDFSVWVPVEYADILKNKYGPDYMTPRPSVRSIEHINAISIVKVKRNDPSNYV